MIYLISQSWRNTAKNHAGIKYLAEYLEANYPDEFTAIVIPRYYKSNRFKNKIINRLYIEVTKIQTRLYYAVLAKQICTKLNANDTVILLEYCDTNINQYFLANKIRRYNALIKIFGMAHIVPAVIDKQFSDALLNKWIDKVDGIITLGHSLTDYYISRGVAKKKIFTTFHYVDKYYDCAPTQTSRPTTVIAMGNQMRDQDMLRNIIVSNKDISFIVCQGMQNLEATFSLPNVRLIPFIEENELREFMASADISLNTMVDTIGSNVIVTSMAMGLAMVCSNVGSIGDYCDETNSILCDNLEDFNNALALLNSNPQLLMDLREASNRKALDYSIENFYTDLKSNILKSNC